MSLLSKNNWFLPFLLSCIVFVIVLISHSFFYTLNKNIQDTYYQIKEILFEKQANPNIIVVEIDEKTLQNIGSFPFKRDTYIPFIDNLNKAGAGIIAFDIIFSDTWDKDQDTLFAEKVLESKNIVLGHAIDERGKLLPLYWALNSEELTTGYFAPLIDRSTDTVYSFAPYRLSDGKTHYHFSISVLKLFFSRLLLKDFFQIPLEKEKAFQLTDTLTIPYSRSTDNEVLISYISGKKFKRVSFVDVYDKNKFLELQKSIDFKDKIVLVWTAAKGIKDIFNTPNGVEYGIYIHANSINTILQKDFIVYFDFWLEWILISLLIFLLVFFNLSRSFFTLVVSNILLFLVFLVIFPIGIITYTNIVINYPSEIVFAFIASFTIANLVKYLIENKEKTLLNKALSQYVSKDIAEEVLSSEGKVHLEGEKKYITIFFSDIQGFTTISEQYSPEGLMSYLREYIRKMSDIIIDKKGFISKYEWDAIVALWGIFWHQDTMSEDACMSAIKQLEQLEDFNKQWERKWFPKVHIRIGVHAGDVIVGNIWTEWRKLEFTALGDAMNLGSRLEWVNKVYGTQICVSDVIYKREKERFDFRFLDTIRVKGKKQSIDIYELIAEKWKSSQELLKNILDFQKAIDLYKKKRFGEALWIFEVLASLGDKPSEMYKERCKEFITNLPRSDWDGVWELKEK